jgi:hypothetical protein
MTKTTPLYESILRQRESLTRLLADPLEDLASSCRAVWGQREALNGVLATGIHRLPHCKFLYAVDPRCVQLSDNVSQTGLLTEDFGRDRSQRPYMRTLPDHGLLLSEAYISLRAERPSLTALQAVRTDTGELLGYLGVDFDLRDLPQTRELYEEPARWQQLKGDPAIRGAVFQQTRSDSPMDMRIDDVMAVLEELITEHGVFHATIHYSSSRAVIWLTQDPYRYRLLDYEALVDPDICLAYPRQPYPDNAAVPAAQIRPILRRMRALRYADPSIYLRASSINIFNGLVSLTFSCDGSHYMPYKEFLDQDMAFWGQDGGVAS